ncbi:MAG: cyclase family protein [Flavobacteriales bacterium]|nr:cyclase family protein [Flavobacteriales bacterium]
MRLHLSRDQEHYYFDTENALDISLPVKRSEQGVHCFYTDKPEYTSFQAGSFIGNVSKGGACNVDVIRFTPHGNGTHTECIGHIDASDLWISQSLKTSLFFCRVITVEPFSEGNDRVIRSELLEKHNPEQDLDALAVRTLPNTISKKATDYSGTNPAYFSEDALWLLNQKNIKHLLCDIPSVDKEDDGGKLLAHKAFFGLNSQPRTGSTITELIYIPDHIEDGLYLLDLQIASFESDASPSRPLLFPLYVV